MVPFAAPIFSENQKIVGVFAAIQKIDALINEIAGTKIGKTGYAFMVDSNALIIAHPRKELILELNLKNLKGMEEIASAMLAHRKGVENYVFEGIQKIAAYAPVEMTGWSVGVTQPRDEFLASAHTIRNGILLVGCVFLALTIVAVLFFARSISRPISRVVQGLSEGAEQVAAASSQVSSSSQSLAEGASEQAASLEETSSSLEEMTSMTRQNADHASEANGLMTEITRVVEESNAAMSALNVSMKDIAGASEETSKIIKTIDEIAFQTNLLALNAAVEAARAGEAGAGFAVVADEVRNLAIRAADAAKNTTSLIETTINKVKEGTQLVNRAGDAFQLVSSSTTKMGELVGEIAAASSEQAQGIDQINKAVAEMDKVVQQNAANAEESAAAAEELNAQAEQMKVYVNELVAVIGGTIKSGKNRRNMVGAAAIKSSQSMQDTSVRKRTPKANGQLKNSGNGKAKTGSKVIERRPEEIIPFDEEEFRDF